MAGDLLVLGFYMIGSVLWLLFWLLCMGYRSILFAPMNGQKMTALVTACILTTVMGLLLTLLETLARDQQDWFLVALSALIPVIGIQIIRQKVHSALAHRSSLRADRLGSSRAGSGSASCGQGLSLQR
ncbi:hypothetical protein ACIPZ5_10875 [Pseudomonas sp. NPDC089428]|uniref:hypothetical protein n=1 Tax=Pseudomonas sp. NPDC089428 TaxID=3364467 RepID=UPI00380B5EB2